MAPTWCDSNQEFKTTEHIGYHVIPSQVYCNVLQISVPSPPPSDPTTESLNVHVHFRAHVRAHSYVPCPCNMNMTIYIFKVKLPEINIFLKIDKLFISDFSDIALVWYWCRHNYVDIVSNLIEELEALNPPILSPRTDSNGHCRISDIAQHIFQCHCPPTQLGIREIDVM